MVVTSLLEHHLAPTPLLTNIYGAIMKVLNKMRVHINLKKTLHVIDSQNRIQNLLRFKPRMFFFDIDDIELVDWNTTNKFARFWYCEDIHHSSILRKAIVKAINKSPDHLRSSKCLRMTPMINKISLLGLYHPTPRAIM
jgi:hypothetical protein